MKALHLPNLPDLNMIKKLWDYLGNYLDNYSIKNFTQVEIDLAKKYMCQEWGQYEKKKSNISVRLLKTDFVLVLNLTTTITGKNNLIYYNFNHLLIVCFSSAFYLNSSILKN